MSSRHWCFTIHKLPWMPGFDQDIVKYIIWQKEIGDETNKEHIQGYIELKKKMGMRKLKKEVLECDSAHVESRQGTRDEAREYCRKIETRIDGPWELGTWEVTQGIRTDIKKLYDMIKDGKKNFELLDEMPREFMKYYKACDKVRSILEKRTIPRWRTVNVEVYYGKAGCGKTRKAYEDNPDMYSVDWTNKWFDGYEGEKTLLIDDFDGRFPFRRLLQLLDGYPIQLETKGGHVWAQWTNIVITSNKHPDEWFKHEDISPLLRRIRVIIHIQ